MHKNRWMKNSIAKAALMLGTSCALAILLLSCTASAATFKVNTSGSGDFTRIQDAVNASINGDIIQVAAGIYSENVIVNKSVTLHGESNLITIIDGRGSGNVINVTANWVIIDGFMIQNGSNGIYITSSSNEFLYNIIRDMHGVNGVDNAEYYGSGGSGGISSGIYLSGSTNNTLTGNTISNLTGGAGGTGGWLGTGGSGGNSSGIYLSGSTNNTLTRNTIGNLTGGVGGTGGPFGSDGSGGNSSGIYLSGSSTNTIYDNYFNSTDTVFDNGNNIWNITKTPGRNIIGGPYLGGNFWANPEGKGFSQTCTDGNGDGICDANNILNENNIDYQPLARFTEGVNLIKNQGFESGTTSWSLYTSTIGTGTFTSLPPGFEGTKAAMLAFGSGDTYIQLYQTDVALKPNTMYRLSFSAYSNTGHDVTVRLFKHVTPYTTYMPDYTANLGSSWQTFTTEFRTAGSLVNVNDGRLVFWLGPFATGGDIYHIDDVRLENVIIQDATLPNISIWYGNLQKFGYIGVPQQWINIPGNVYDLSGIASLNYSLNNGSFKNLSIGPDGLRLESSGDFNIEINRTNLLCGDNQIVITAADYSGNVKTELITVQYSCNNVWPMNYSINWSNVTNIQDAAQIVDGLWIKEQTSIRPSIKGYDRVVAIGDVTWSDYEMAVPITINTPLDSSLHGPNFGIGMRWQGHYNWNGEQPNIGWFPFGAIGAYIWIPQLNDYQLRIFGNNMENIAIDDSGKHLETGVTYMFKMKAITNSGRTLYSLKVWEQNTIEPSAWTISGYGVTGELKQGSAILITYYSNVSFGNVTITSGQYNGNIIAPSITTHPVNQTVYQGQIASFTAIAAGTAPLTYQWQKNSVNIMGATNSSYKTGATTLSDSGSTYRVNATNAAGNVISNSATLTVLPAASGNLIKNPAFESGTASWYYWSDTGAGSLGLASGYEGANAAKITIGGSIAQLYQYYINLETNTRYRLSFAAYSTSGRDMSVRVIKHGSPYTMFTPDFAADLSTGWQTFYTEFNSTNSFNVTDGRLQFLISPAVAGDIYYLDNVVLEKVSAMDITPPQVIGNMPTGTNVPITAKISLNFSEEMNKSFTELAFSTIPATTGSFSWSGNNMTYIPDSNLLYNTTYNVTIGTGARDIAGNNMLSLYFWQFTTKEQDKTPPLVIENSPTGSNVSLGVQITVNFSEEMNKSLAESSFSTYPAIAGGSFSWSGNNMTFTPVSNLLYNTTYNVTIGTGAKDIAGNNMGYPYEWQFTTREQDLTPPAVIGNSPTLTNVSPGAKIMVNFSEPMNRSITESAFLISPTTTGSFSWNGNNMTFTPVSNLLQNTTYNVTIESGAKDLAGNNMLSNYIWQFVTATSSINIINNPGFESGTASWYYWSNTGAGSLGLTSPGYGGNNSAKITIGGTITQLYQYSIKLERNSRYRLSFAAYSTSGRDLTVNLIQHSSPYASYGLAYPANLSTGWQTFSTEFSSTNSVNVTDGRLQFLISPAVAGDIYYLDNVVLEKVVVMDIMPPSIIGATPTGTNVTITSQITVTFNKLMNNASAESAFSISPTAGGSFSWSGNTMKYTLSSSLSYGTTYNVTIGTGAKDLAGNNILSNYSWQFTTSSVSINMLKNPGFESGTASWYYWSDTGAGTLALASGYEGNNSAKITIGGTIAQLYQYSIKLEPNIRYRLSFASYSTSGRDLTVNLIQHGSPNTNYGLAYPADLGTSWKTFSTEFNSTNSVNVTDGRLQFLISPAVAGDIYYIDDVRLEKAGTTLPNITIHPASQTVNEGQTAMFEVAATGISLSYQWQKNSTNIPGATGATYTTPMTTLDDNGTAFRVIVSNASGSVTSNTANLTVISLPLPPFIIEQPSNQKITEGQTSTFTVVAAGARPLSYQWQKNGSNIPGATNASYTIPPAVLLDNGSTYRVNVTNTLGSLISNAATLFVTEQPPGPAWFDLSRPFRVPVTVNAAQFERYEKPVEVRMDFTQMLNILGQAGTFAENSIRVVEIDSIGTVLDSTVSFQFDKDPDFNAATKASGNLVFIMSGTTQATGNRYYQVYFGLTGGSYSPVTVAPRVNITDGFDELQDSYKIGAAGSTYYFQKQAGGFSSWLDSSGNDWINYSPAAGSAGAYHGIPNVYAGGIFHPGWTCCTSSIVSQGPLKISIRSVTPDGNWESLWDFYPGYATMTMVKAGGSYWWLYEGTPGGVIEINKDFMVRSDNKKVLLSQSTYDDIPTQEWAYFSDPTVNRSLFVSHHEDDSFKDEYFQFESGMTAFGFGRINNPLTGLLSGKQRFTMGLTEGTEFAQTANTVYSAYKYLTVTKGAIEPFISAMPPIIVTQPGSVTVSQGTSATFSVSATGQLPLSYQWQRNDVNIIDATNASYTISSATLPDNGSRFRVVLTNTIGSVTSDPATLTVWSPSSNQMVLIDESYTHDISIKSVTLLKPAVDGLKAADSGKAFSLFNLPPWVPDNLVSPVNYAQGKLYTRLQVINKPSTYTIQYQFCSFQDKMITPLHACTYPVVFSGTGTYYYSIPMTNLIQYNNISWDRYLLLNLLAIKDINGVPIDDRYGYDGQWIGSPEYSLYYPMKVRYTAIIVPPGGGAPVWPADSPPVISSQPTNKNYAVGETVTFNVEASGIGPLYYQWQKNGVNISGAYSSSYTTPPATIEDDGAIFRVIVSNYIGSVTSADAKLTFSRPINNIIQNPGFELGTTSWYYWSDTGAGTLGLASPGYEGNNSGKITVGGTIAQLYQYSIKLERNTRYRLSFAAYSTTGRDFSVNLIQHGPPYTNYGLVYPANLGTGWQTFSTEFNSTNSVNVTDGRLQFLISPAVAGEIYYLDNVVVEKAVATDTIPPQVIGNKPTGTNVPVTARISLNFSEPMNQASAQAAFSTVPVTTGSFSWSGNNMTYSPNSNLTYNTTYNVTVGTGARDLSGNNMLSSYNWSFTTVPDTTPPSVISNTPAGSNVSVASRINVTFSKSMNNASVELAFLTSPPITGSFSWNGNNMTFTPVSNLAYNTTYNVTIGTGARDLAGNNMSSSYFWQFTTKEQDIIPPQVIGNSPTGSNVSLAAQISVNFSEEMNKSFAESAFSTNPAIAGGSFSWSGNNMTFTPVSNLAYSTTYNVTIGTGARDLAGNNMSSSYFWQFTTKEQDLTPPAVIGNSPTLTNVSPGAQIMVNFSEPMNRSITESAFSISPTATGSFSWNGNNMTFTPVSNLAYNTTYNVTIGTGAKDLAGNNMGSPYSWPFTTIKDTTTPWVIGSMPIGTNVPITSQITVTFNKSMNTTSAESAFSTVPATTGSFSWSGGNTMKYTPASSLSYGTTYSVRIGSEAKDLAGNTMMLAYNWQFTTSPASINLLMNPGFELGTASWYYWSDSGAGALGLASPGYEGNNSAKITIGGTIAQVYQYSIKLEGNTRYRLSFAAYSTSGRDVTVNLIQHGSPYASYGLAYPANLSTGWQTFSTEFNSTNSVNVTDGRLQFLISPAVAGDIYYLDNVVLEKASGIDITPPQVIGNMPTGTNVPITAKITLNFSEGMNKSFTESAFSIIPAAIGSFSWSGNSMIYTPVSNLPYSTTYNVTIGTGAKDLAGNNMQLPYNWQFTTTTPDIIPPQVIGNSPTGSNVSLAAQISVNFSEEMNKSFAESSFSTNPAIAGGSFSWNGNNMTFTPISNLAYNTTYNVTIGTGAKDIAGNNMVSPYEWQFTTREQDLTPPTVIGSSPTLTNVSSGAKIMVNFSEPMNKSITESAFSISPTATGSFSWNGNNMTFTPVSNLLQNTTYNVTIGTGAKDLAGNNILSNYSWQFVTATASINMLMNPGFELGTASWYYWSDSGAGTLGLASPGYGGNNSAKITIGGTIAQVYQYSIKLERNTKYRLSFAAYSTSGRDVTVNLIQHGSPYASYGLAYPANLSTGWQTFSTGFNSTNSVNVTDGRLQFLISPAVAGDIYYMDNVVLEKVI